jgi:hypothetical protein
VGLEAVGDHLGLAEVVDADGHKDSEVMAALPAARSTRSPRLTSTVFNCVGYELSQCGQ